MGRGLIASEAAALGFEKGVDLASGEKLSRAYERTTAFSKTYVVDGLPSDEELQRDALNAVSLVGHLYRAVELGRAPETTSPDVVAANVAIAAIARPGGKKGTGQGFGLSSEERRLVEEHAMAGALTWLQDNGFENIRDVHLTHSCDFMARRNGVDHCIEVKGTTAGYGSILLTANEVALHKSSHPHNVLLVMHDIDLLEMRTKATGGLLRVLDPWEAESAHLTPLSYSCNLLAGSTE